MLGLIFMSTCSYEDDPVEEEIIPTEALEFVKGLGIGINIGNNLDAISNSNTGLPAGETGWGNRLITLEFIQAVKSFGFTTIRLPVTWAEFLGPAPAYTIDQERLDRVTEVVDWILNEDLYCIINLHHDGGSSPRSWILDFATDEDRVGDMFVKVWKQIAERFKDYPYELIFESMNEVGFDSVNPRAERFRKFNKLNQLFVDTVRPTGSKNATRYLLIAGYWTDITETVDPLFQMPVDTVENRQIVSIHYYTPSQFAIASSTASGFGFRDNWGNDIRAEADYAALNRNFDRLVERFVSKGIPVINGEYGVVRTNKVEEGRIRWLTAVTEASLERGICPIFWDNGNGEVLIGRRNTDVPPIRRSSTLEVVWRNIGLLEDEEE
jgi:endoglucanase